MVFCTDMKVKIAAVVLCLALFGVGAFISKNKRSSNAQSQFSDNELYLQYCKEAAEDDTLFAAFKRNPIYNLFYEGMTFEEGNDHLRIAFAQTPEIFDSRLLEKIRRLDCIGRPHVHNYGFAGPFSPSTLYYMKIASDLKLRFGEIDRLSVIEINGGSGGLCKVLHDIFDIDQYTIVDLGESAELSKKHLSKQGLSHVQFITPEEMKLMECDLLISYGGMTDASKSLQKRYIKHLLPGALRGYLICHFFPRHYGLKGFRKGELIERIQQVFPIEIQPEQPPTGKENCILTWSAV